MNLAYRMRPRKFAEFVGQSHLVGNDGVLRKTVVAGNLFSMIFWGPPGSGKTTLANIIASESAADFFHLSAVESGKDDLRKVLEKAKVNQTYGKRTILFIDEIHRWNKAQQDALLPYVESGLLILIGATTENPSFEVISPLLSRCRIFVLNHLEISDLDRIIEFALSDRERGLGKFKIDFGKKEKDYLVRLSGGDARVMLNALEIAVQTAKKKEITQKTIEEVFQKKSAGLYDKKGDEHYNVISAFIKSVRGSDCDAALYYLAKMLESGEDPKFIARRMIILASEDIGLADRGALIQANAAFEAVAKIGMPEAQLILAHIAIYLARAPKSRLVVNSLDKAKKAVYEFPDETVPLYLRNAPTKLMKELGFAKDYTWSEKYVGPKKDKSFLPEKLKGRKFVE
ncbi:MAG: Recombination protein MgsA [Candidatus Gottesmanbacteria bacterium GW2011_GWA2_42_18]|uniref:Recombination protein MgsA n=1 Tax=Candidatus Gottesmanbacteria bacterium GW2011_GWA2_42_18 TaxID=1618442 RepID=A0A0G0ZFM3_9BACT|nr:MAG: Recombination protein MgsA [Candidatus Gottesmanbacteria bacterium GW2011_GWA2_42_18]